MSARRHTSAVALTVLTVASLTLGGGVGAGVAVAGGLVGSPELANDSVRSVDLKDGRVRSRDLHDGAVTTAEVRDGSLTAPDFAAGVLEGGGAPPTEVVSFQIDWVSDGSTTLVQPTSSDTIPANSQVMTLLTDLDSEAGCPSPASFHVDVWAVGPGLADTRISRYSYNTDLRQWREQQSGAIAVLPAEARLKSYVQCWDGQGRVTVPDFHLDLTLAVTPVEVAPTRTMH